MAQQESIPQNKQSGQEVAKGQASDLPGRRAAKTHKDFWRARLERRCYTHEGELSEVNEWSIRIQHLGRRKSFALGTNNQEVAAVKARDIYLAIVAQGWQAAEELFNPEMVVRKDDPTLGDFLRAVEAKAELKPKTYRLYCGFFRKIVADVFRIAEGKARFSYRDGSRARWLEKVDAVKLANITPDRINDWRTYYIKRAGSNPIRRQSAIRNANSYVRCARALFSTKWLSRLGLRLPTPLPFQGVKVERNRAPRYKISIGVGMLLTDARKELAEKDTPAYLVFLIALGAGLRKGEIDCLEWKHINLDKGVIAVETTEFRGVKTPESEAEVEIDPELGKELLAHKSKSRFVIESCAPPRPGLDRQYYRAEAVFQRLYLWLRSKGVNTSKPLHTLRKEFGSIINEHFGLYAAMTALRHADIKTTSSHYTDNKRRIALPLTKILDQMEALSVSVYSLQCGVYHRTESFYCGS